MEQSLNYYTLIGFASETAVPDNLETISISADEAALFLNFDGTFVDISDTPSAIKITEDDNLLLEKLSKRHQGAVSIVSGRNLKEILHYIAGFTGTVSGGHGAELFHAGRELPGIECDFERLDHIRKAVREFEIIDPRVLAEYKSYGIVLHFRQHPELEGKVHDFLDCLVQGDDTFELQTAKMAVEIKPKGISKASAIEQIMAFDEFSGRNILYAGDDVADEVAFSWVNEQGGITIKIGDGPTVAHYRTASPATFKAWLHMQPDSGQGT